MLFNFQSFIEKLRADEQKKIELDKYEQCYGQITGSIEEQVWYKEYLINFKKVEYNVPEELRAEFDWELLGRLCVGSFSSETSILITSESILPDLEVSVKSGEDTVIKKINELWSFQILRLYEIYIEEQQNLQVLVKTDKNEANAILSQRQARLQRWDKSFKVTSIKREAQSYIDELD